MKNTGALPAKFLLCQAEVESPPPEGRDNDATMLPEEPVDEAANPEAEVADDAADVSGDAVADADAADAPGVQME